MKKSAIATGLALMASGFCYAGTYQVEVTPGYSMGEIEVPGGDIDTDVFVIGGEYYLDAVDDSKGPLAEAAFLDRASSVRAAYETGEYEDTDVDGFALGGRFVDQASGWIFGADYREFEIDGGGDTDTWDLTVGKYIAENTTLSFTYSSEDTGNNDNDTYSVDVKHLTTLSNGAYISVAGVLGIGDVDEGDDPIIYGGSLTYYPVRNIGVGAAAAFSDSDDSDNTGYSVFGSWFPSDTLAITASYQLTDDDEREIETDTFSVGAKFRF